MGVHFNPTRRPVDKIKGRTSSRVLFEKGNSRGVGVALELIITLKHKRQRGRRMEMRDVAFQGSRSEKMRLV